ncbi:sigma-54-dependent transcriptional regulator [Desulfosarcina ovata]|uniref:Acetoacetate metabolism regulatory protein AtoC n=1 Tax=Desulfosarcina ovata subsp. ovata TaxID=2752305 RepID=A0A5K8AG54_9BACT|nr:sigma-54 dependent transcriptional regulator [Desulfosarcina ovata]BBO91528.1 acetoacetate metabolism regulatory protein AtoC [Desulfosarcina ovata subsp. ovata]
MEPRLLIVEDEPDMLLFLKRFFRRKGYAVTAVPSAEEAWNRLAETEHDLVISDLVLEGMSGIDLLKEIRAIDRILPFIIITGAGTIESAVEAIKIGAFHYVTKPFKREELEFTVKRAVEFGAMHRRLSKLDEEEKDAGNNNLLIIGESQQMKKIISIIEKVSASDTSVLIQGETGTGKTMLARHIHSLSNRSEGPFVTIDCGALPENLLESELFGHVKGAFTGAVRAKRGLLEEAHGGTVFLDEIGELPPQTQVKLLRTIQELEIRPVGGNHPIKIDVRVISATNRNLKKEVDSGGFREDLYYRLSLIPLHLPALRERREDLLQFVGQFVREFNQRHNKKITKLSHTVMRKIMELPWKGNIRELKNVIERAVLLSDGYIIDAECFGAGGMDKDNPGKDSNCDPVLLKKAVEEAEKNAIRRALRIAKGNRSKAAVFLGIGRRTLYDKLAYYQIED